MSTSGEHQQAGQGRESRIPDGPTERAQREGVPGAEIDVLIRALESAVFGVGITDLEGRVTYVNDAVRRLWRYETKDEIIGRSLEEFWEGEGIHETLAALRSGGGRTGEDVAKRRDGTLFPVQFSANVVLGEDGRPVCTIGCFVDITEVKEAAEQRRAVERKLWDAQKLESLGLLAGGVAHDFNNLLVAILGSADLARSELPSESPARRFIEDAMVGARRAADLAQQMLAYSGRGQVVIRPVDLRALATEMATLLRASVDHQISLRLELGDRPARVEGDVSQLRQVLLNLIINASEAIGERPGTVFVTAGVQRCDEDYLAAAQLGDGAEPGSYAYMEVSDTGSGMDAETLSQIFDPFFTSKKTGRGLGLSAVQGIIRGHKGALRVYSELRKGTTFKVLLPEAPGEPPMEVKKGGPVTVPADQLVLLADDEEMVRRVARRMLERMGISVVVATDGEEALALGRANVGRIACVVLDLTMPRMDGEACFRALRRLQPDIPVVLSSGYTTKEVSERFAGRGRIAFLQKPYDQVALSRAIAEAMGE